MILVSKLVAAVGLLRSVHFLLRTYLTHIYSVLLLIERRILTPTIGVQALCTSWTLTVYYNSLQFINIISVYNF